MKRPELEGVLDAILNRADFSDLEVLKAAFERRAGDLNRIGRAGFDPGVRAVQEASSIQDQIGTSREQLDSMVRGLVEGLIRQKAPDIPEEHLQELLAEWAPDSEQREKRRIEVKPRPSRIPAEALSVMVREFVAYSTGAMSAREQINLNDEIADWTSVYWKAFPERIQKLIKVLLDGKLSIDEFWAEIQATLDGQRE